MESESEQVLEYGRNEGVVLGPGSLGCGAVEGLRRGGLKLRGCWRFLLLPLQLFSCLETGEIQGPPVGRPVPG